jgi:putative ABC transport system permease protein
MTRQRTGSFLLIYLRHELRRRSRQTLLSAAGLAVGVGIVLTVTAAAAGVSSAQATVLHSLYGIGTDVTVTVAPPASSPGGGGLFSAGKTAQTHDTLRVVPGLGTLDAASAQAIARLRGVAAAAAGLTLTDTVWHIPAVSPAGTGLGGHGTRPGSDAGNGTGLGTVTSFNVDGVDVRHLGLGPFSSGRVSKGRTFTSSDSGSDVAVVDSGYATAHRLSVGSAINTAGHSFRVIGVIDQARGAGSADVYIPLGRAQALGSFQGTSALTHKVSTIYVAAANASDVAAVQHEISKLLPGATVTSSASLAHQVNGSLASAASLATDLGRWLAIAVLVTAFAVAVLLVSAAVTRRVRDLGTLKALGWKSRRVITQLMAEAAVTGVLGALIGVGIGFGGAALIDAVSPRLSATVAQNPGSSPAQGVTISGGSTHITALPGSAHTVAVTVHAPVHLTMVAIGVLLALAGALIAGSYGAWRATRLSPAAALANVT